jgi:hypothetical protein
MSCESSVVPAFEAEQLHTVTTTPKVAICILPEATCRKDHVEARLHQYNDQPSRIGGNDGSVGLNS